jgi:hypothetical protein
LLIECKADGIFLVRFGAAGEVAGDTWHESLEDAKGQATSEYGRDIEWVRVPADVEDVVAFAQGRQAGGSGLGLEMIAQLREALGNLAAPAEAQVAHLRELGSHGLADELALEFDDVASAALASGALSEAARTAVLTLDDALKRMSGSERGALWTEAAITETDEWRSVRSLARTALDELSRTP